MEIRIALFPQLAQLCWNRPDDTILDGPEALALYERNWRFVDTAALEAGERDLIDRLAEKYGNGVLLVT